MTENERNDLNELIENYEKKQKSDEILDNQQIKSLVEEAISLNLDINIHNIIIDCNYVKSCVIKKLEVIIATENIRINILNQEKNKLKLDKN